MTGSAASTVAWGPPLELRPLPGGRHQAAVAIVGGGLAGLSTAFHLLQDRPGLDVVLVEAAGLGAGASGRSTGMLTPGVGQNLPGQLRRYGSAATGQMYNLTLQAVRDAQTLIAQQSIDCGLHMGGQLIVARGRAGRRRLRRLADVYAALQLPCQTLDDRALQARIQLSASARTPAGSGPAALHLPVAGVLDPMRLIKGLAGRVAALGGRIYTHSPVQALTDQELQLSAGRSLRAERIVVANAALAPRLGVHRGRVLPVEIQALLSEPLSADARSTLGWRGMEGVIDSRRLFNYFRLRQDGRIIFGGGRPALRSGRSGPREPSPRARASLTSAFQRCFPAGVAPPVARVWSGLIATTLDGLPAIGPLPGRPRILHVGGCCGHGIALSLAAGRWAARLLSGEVLSGGSAPWFRSRPPLLPLSPLRWLGFHATVTLMALADRQL